MAEFEGEVWQCRLCPVRGMAQGALENHLRRAHGTRPVDLRLHAAKDTPEQAENTLGFYDGAEQLIAVMARISVRPLDDPTRFGG